LKIACLEEVAYRKGYLTRDGFAKVVADIPKSSYREYLEMVLNDGVPE